MRTTRTRRLASVGAALLLGLVLSCDDFPGWNTGPSAPDFDEEPSATLNNPPAVPAPDEGAFEATFFAWKFGGSVQCGTPAVTPNAPGDSGFGGANGLAGANGQAGAPGAGTPGQGAGGAPGFNETSPITVTIMDGVADPCVDSLDEGDRLITIEVSDIRPGIYPIAQACVGNVGADAIFGVFHGQMLLTRRAVEGQVSLQGLDERNILQGAYSIRFDGETSFTSGSFRVESLCF